MIDDGRIALFLMLGQSAEKVVSQIPELAPSETLAISPSYDLATLMPESVKSALMAAEAYKLFFVFESYLREFIVDVLSKDTTGTWWDKIPSDVEEDVAKMEETEEAKRWMALGSRDKSALMTYPQLLRVIDHCWKMGFEDLLRDKSLIQEARVIGHLRNTICHMSSISEEEMRRIRQTMRDWFRMVAP
jgi:hypothetical protein